MNPKLILAAALTLGVAGAAFAQGQSASPASSPPEAAKAEAAKPERACFFNRDIRGFAAPDDKTLYLRVRSKEVFRLEMMGRCPDFDWESRLAIDSRGSSSLCYPVDATVIVLGTVCIHRFVVRAHTLRTPADADLLDLKVRAIPLLRGVTRVQVRHRPRGRGRNRPAG